MSKGVFMFAKRLSIIAGVTVLMMGFQNCQPAKVSASDSSSKLAPLTQNDVEDTADGAVAQEGEDPAAPVDPVDPIPPTNPPTSENPPGKKPPKTPPGGGANADGSGQYVCILEGPGKSVKLGVLNDLGGQHKIPQVLCMSRAACLNIASQAFEVKGPEFRGYCKLPHGNPHVVHVTDAELQTKVDEYLKQP